MYVRTVAWCRPSASGNAILRDALPMNLLDLTVSRSLSRLSRLCWTSLASRDESMEAGPSVLAGASNLLFNDCCGSLCNHDLLSRHKALYGLLEVLEEVPAIRDLHGMRCSPR